MGKRYGFVTPGDMFAYYYNNEAVRWLTVLSAVLYSMFYSGLQLIAAAKLFQIVAGVPYTAGLLFMAFIVWFYVVTGGLKASTWVGVIQFVLLVAQYHRARLLPSPHPALGGWHDFSGKIDQLEAKYLDVPKVINFGLKGGWTAVMILTYMFALMGIQSSPAFTLWNYGMASPKPLAWQQVFMSTFVVGLALFFFTAFQGMGARVLAGMGEIAPKVDGDVVPMLMNYLLPGPMMAIVFLGIIAAIHSTAAPYIGTGGTIVLRDVYWRYFKKQEAGHSEQIWANRVFVTLLTVLAIIVSLTAPGAIVMIGGFATSFGFIMYLMLLGVHYGFKYPTIGVVIGLIGAIAACFRDLLLVRLPAVDAHRVLGTVRRTGYRLLCRGIGIKDNEETIKRQAEVRAWLDSIDSPTPTGRKWRDAMKFLVPLWYLFAIGPACILGNSAFSFAGFTPLWSWQIVWWIIGIIMMWALCFKAEMSTTSDEQIARAETDQMIVVKEA